jgi:nicotinamide-nucleotide amidase
MLFERNGKYVVSLPGVPAEMKFIMTNSVLPMVEKIIDKLGDDIVLYKTLMTSGVPESVLADKIGNVDAFLRDSDSLAFLPSYKGVRLRIGVRGNKGYAEKRLQEIEKYIRDRVDEYIIAGDDISLAEVVGKTLADAGETVAVAESCTGGLLGGEFTSVSGSSAYFAGGVIAYSNEIKEKILGVEHQILIEHGAVSRETAEQMAQNVRSKFNVDYGISITGIAGPTGGTPDKPVGTVWIAVSSKEGNIAKKFNFGADRNVNRQRSVGAALNLLLQTIKTTGK